MRIGFIEDTHLRGGTQIWVIEATRDFIAKGHDVTVLAPEGSHVATLCAEAGAVIFPYDWDDIVANPDSYREAWTEGLRNMDVAVCTVHPPREDFHCSIYAAQCIKAASLDTVLMPKTGSIVPWYLREYYQPDPDVNTQIICITNFTREYLVDVYELPAEHIDLVYQGTEVNRFTSTPETKAEALSRYALPENAGPVLGSIGALENRKGQIILLQAVKRLLDSDKLPDIHVMFVGEGPDEAMLKAVTDVYGLQKHVTFFPFTDEPNYVFERLDILALPSLYKEGLPNVLLEAMSMQVPVISTKLAGIPEVVIEGETGYLTDPGNIEQFSDAIESAWQSREACAEMGQKARQIMEETMDKKNQFDAFLNCFRQTIETRQ
jgi:glycosyltransferase involved in cell wall biosynthesis